MGSEETNKPKVGAKKLRHMIHEKLDHVVLWDATDIRIKVSKGTVTLLGTVADKDALHKAEELVASIEGVTAVKNLLKIKGPGLAAVISEIAAEFSKVMTDEEHEHKHPPAH